MNLSTAAIIIGIATAAVTFSDKACGQATKQTLTDSSNRIIGYIETSSHGRQTLTDARNRVLGYFEPQNNTTTDARNHIVGHGNLLTTLLK